MELGPLGLIEQSCPLCGAQVLTENVQRHEQWHERQTQILKGLTETVERLARLAVQA